MTGMPDGAREVGILDRVSGLPPGRGLEPAKTVSEAKSELS